MSTLYSDSITPFSIDIRTPHQNNPIIHLSHTYNEPREPAHTERKPMKFPSILPPIPPLSQS